jgi:hypothetical protein
MRRRFFNRVVLITANAVCSEPIEFIDHGAAIGAETDDIAGAYDRICPGQGSKSRKVGVDIGDDEDSHW